MTEKNEMIFGVRAVIEAIQAGKEIDKILVKRDIQSELSKPSGSHSFYFSHYLSKNRRYCSLPF